MLDRLEANIKEAGAQSDDMLHVFHVAICKQSSDDSVPGELEAFIATPKPRLEAMGIKFVNALCSRRSRAPIILHLPLSKDFKEDMLYRGERPTVAHLLELARLENYLDSSFRRVNRDLHMYVGESETGSSPWPGQTLVASPSLSLQGHHGRWFGACAQQGCRSCPFPCWTTAPREFPRPEST